MDTLPEVSSLIDDIKSAIDSDAKTCSAQKEQSTPPPASIVHRIANQSTNSSSRACVAEFNIVDHRENQQTSA